jgi:hypothetical protein
VKTSGIFTNGTWAKTWTHHLTPILDGRPVASGITASDITSQIVGPKAAATPNAPAGVSIARRSAGHARFVPAAAHTNIY